MTVSTCPFFPAFWQTVRENDASAPRYSVWTLLITPRHVILISLRRIIKSPTAFQNQGQSYTPVKGWRDELPQDPSADLCDPPLPPVWDWALQYSKHRQESFTQPVATTTVHQPLLNGNLNIKKDQHKVGLVYCFAFLTGVVRSHTSDQYQSVP